MDVRAFLSERLASVRGRIADACRRAGRSPDSVTLVAVTKTVSPAVAAVALDLGMTDLGENRPQELWKKSAALHAARFHLIGHLQRNKIDRTVPLTHLVHSVDSERLLDALDAFGRSRNRAVPILLEVNCSREASKGGLSPDALLALSDKALSLTGVSVRGLMTMAAYHDDPELCRPAFAELRRLRDRLGLAELSMGMSNDFEVAIEEGATLVRVGTTLFEGLANGPA